MTNTRGTPPPTAVHSLFFAASLGSSVTGMVGTHVVAVDADTGTVIAGTLSGWSCDPANLPTRFDGSFDLECFVYWPQLQPLY